MGNKFRRVDKKGFEKKRVILSFFIDEGDISVIFG